VRDVTWVSQSRFTDPGAAGAVIDELPADLAALREVPIRDNFLTSLASSLQFVSWMDQLPRKGN
jgi:hypothetical protein